MTTSVGYVVWLLGGVEAVVSVVDVFVVVVAEGLIVLLIELKMVELEIELTSCSELGVEDFAIFSHID